MRARKMPPNENTLPWISKVILDIHAHLVGQNTSENALLGVSIDSGNFSQCAGGVSIRPVETFSVHD